MARLSAGLPLLLLCFSAVGCGDPGPAPLRLILVSPHRDELREETALAFRDWFAERTQTHLAEARQAIEKYIEQPNEKHRTAVDATFARLIHDWSADDLDDLPAFFSTWQRQPTAESARALGAALDRWPGPRRPVEFVWQDVGGGTSAIQRFVEARFQMSPNGIGIDVLFGGGTDMYLRLASLGYLEKLDMTALLRGRIPEHLNGVPLYDAQGRWFGPMVSSFGILVNREVLRRIGEPEPTAWTDLARPSMRGWVNAADPRLTGSIHMVYEIILQGEGWDPGFRTLARLGANAHSFSRDSGTLTRSVSIGEVAAAGTVDVQALGAVNRAPQMMNFVLPKNTVINADAVAVLLGAPRKELARAFVEYTLSDAGQKLFLLRPGEPGGPRKYALARLSVVEKLYEEYPPEARAVGAANPFAQRSESPYRANVSNRRWDALNDLFGAVIVDAHDDLAAAWKALQESRLPDADKQRLEEELFRPPVTEQELEAHAKRIIEQGPRSRSAQVNQWGEEARARYRRIRRAAGG